MRGRGTPVTLHAVALQSLRSHVRLFVTLWMAACQAIGVSFPKYVSSTERSHVTFTRATGPECDKEVLTYRVWGRKILFSKASNSAQSRCWQKAEGSVPLHLFMAINCFASLKGNSINPFPCVTLCIIKVMGNYS